jgi:IPT/TIG domain
MRNSRMRIPVAVLTLFVATSLSAQNVRFDPPNPTSRTPVTAHVVVAITHCGAPSGAVSRNGSIISIALAPNCAPATDPIFGTVDIPVDLGVVPPGVYDVVASPGMLLVAIAEGTLVVRDAAPPSQVTPNVSALGGLQVALTGSNLISCTAGITPPICTNAIVKFGDSVATIVSATPDQILVQAPQHSPGIVDVTIDRNGNVLRSTASFYYAPNDKTPDPAFYEPVFFPIAFSGPGAFGSQWTTQINMRNENDYSVALLPLSTFNLGCVFECDLLVPKHSTRTTGINTPNGFFAYVPRQASPAVHFDTLIKDLSRQSEALGTEIPVVREKDFFDRPLELLNVPTDPRFRVALRVYGPSASLTIQPLNSDDVLVSTFVNATGNPPLAQISDLVGTYPQLAGKGPLRITVSPSIPGNPNLWAFVSVTNNETQHVTTISPQ